MSTSQDSAPDSPTHALPQPKRIVLPHRPKPDADKMGKGTGKQQASQKSQKGSKKGQRLDLRTLLQGAPDEGLESKVEDYGNKRPGKTSLRSKSTGPSGDDTDSANFDDVKALPQSTTERTEYDYDDEEQVDSDTFDDDDDVSIPSKLPTQSRRSGKRDFGSGHCLAKTSLALLMGPLHPASRRPRRLRSFDGKKQWSATGQRMSDSRRMR